MCVAIPQTRSSVPGRPGSKRERWTSPTSPLLGPTTSLSDFPLFDCCLLNWSGPLSSPSFLPFPKDPEVGPDDRRELHWVESNPSGLVYGGPFTPCLSPLLSPRSHNPETSFGHDSYKCSYFGVEDTVDGETGRVSLLSGDSRYLLHGSGGVVDTGIPLGDGRLAGVKTRGVLTDRPRRVSPPPRDPVLGPTVVGILRNSYDYARI